jgi:hypothetical protein
MLHGFWCTLPNFNPYTVSSDPGQDLADEALSVLMGGHRHGGLGLIRVQFLLQMELTSLLVQDEGDSYSLPPTLDDDDVLYSAGSISLTLFTPCTSIIGSS